MDTRFADLLDFPTMPPREVTLDSHEMRHIEAYYAALDGENA